VEGVDDRTDLELRLRRAVRLQITAQRLTVVLGDEHAGNRSEVDVHQDALGAVYIVVNDGEGGAGVGRELQFLVEVVSTALDQSRFAGQIGRDGGGGRTHVHQRQIRGRSIGMQTAAGRSVYGHQSGRNVGSGDQHAQRIVGNRLNVVRGERDCDCGGT